MRRLALLVAAAATLSMFALPARAGAEAGQTPEPQAERPSKIAALLHEAIDDPDRFPGLRIDVEGFLDAGIRSLTVYGRGFGVWNRERQIELSEKQVGKCLKLLEKHGFLSMPERIGSEPTNERGRLPGEVTQLIRSVTLVVGEMSRTVEQDNKAPESAALREMVAGIVAICERSAKKGVAATDLADGLKKIADGSLAPELLEISANAPELRSLADQEGQGWMMHLSHGVLTVTPHSLDHGVGAPVSRRLTEREIRDLARLLVREGAPSWPINLNLPGYLQLSVRVLNRNLQVMARRFAARPAPEPSLRASLVKVRQALHDLPKAIDDRSR